MQGNRGLYKRLSGAADNKFYGGSKKTSKRNLKKRAMVAASQFDDHAIRNLSMISLILALIDLIFRGGNVDVSKLFPFYWFLLCMGYYVIKSILITADTIIHWDERHPGEPMFKAGGLTEYDRTYAETIGKSVAEEMKRLK
jgi:hypothetical protein